MLLTFFILFSARSSYCSSRGDANSLILGLPLAVFNPSAFKVLLDVGLRLRVAPNNDLFRNSVVVQLYLQLLGVHYA